LTIIVVNLVAKFYAVAKISQIYCWGILIWATLYSSIGQNIKSSAVSDVRCLVSDVRQFTC